MTAQKLRQFLRSPTLALRDGLPIIGCLLGHRRVEPTTRYSHLARDSVRDPPSESPSASPRISCRRYSSARAALWLGGCPAGRPPPPRNRSSTICTGRPRSDPTDFANGIYGPRLQILLKIPKSFRERRFERLMSLIIVKVLDMT